MAEGLIDSIIDKSAIEAQFAYMTQSLDDLLEKINSISTKKVGSLFQQDTNLKQNIDGYTQLTTASKELQRITDQLSTATARLAATQSDGAKQLASVKIQQQQQNQALKDEAQLNQAAEGSINQKKIQLKQLQAQYDALSDSQRNASDGQALLANVQQLDSEVKKLQGDTGRFQLNVGNYQGSAAVIVNALKDVESEITNLKQKQTSLQNFSTSNPIGFKLGGGQDSLNQVNAQLDTLQKEFTSLNGITSNPQFLNIASKVGDTRGEIGFLQRSLVSLRAENLQDTGAFKSVENRLVSLTRDFRDTREEVKALSSQTRGFDLFSSAVTTAARSAELFVGFQTLVGEKSEDVTRSIQKIVAIQSIANGTQEIARQLTERGTAANKAYVFVQQQIGAITNISTSATEKFSAALKLSGIGLLVTAVGFLIDKLDIFGKNEKTAAEKAQDLNEVLKQQTDILQKEVALIGEHDQAVIKSFTNQLEIAEKSGAGFTTLLALRRQLANEEKNIADQELIQAARNQTIDAASVTSRETALDLLIKAQGRYNSNYQAMLSVAQSATQRFNDSQKDDDKKDLEKANNDAALARQQLDNVTSLINNANSAQQKIDSLTTEELKFNADERRKFVLQSAQVEVQATKDKNALILSDEKSTLAQRLAAIQSNLQADIRAAKAERDNILSDPGKSTVDRSLAIKAENQKELSLKGKFNQDVNQLNESYRLKDLQAEQTIQQLRIDTDLKANQTILDNENSVAAAKRVAAQNIFNDQKEQIELERDLQIEQAKSAGATAKQLEAIERQADDNIFNARKELAEKLKAITLQQQQSDHENDLQTIQNQYDEQLNILDRALLKGEISQKAYDKRKLLLQANLQKSLIESEIAYTQNLVDQQKVRFAMDEAELQEKILVAKAVAALEIDPQKKKQELAAIADAEGQYKQLQISDNNAVAASEQKLAALKIKLADVVNAFLKAKSDDSNKNFEDTFKKISDAAEKTFDFIAGLEDAQIEAQKNKIQGQINDINAKSDAEIDAVNRSILSEQDKSNKIAVINARTKAQTDQLQRQQQALDIQKAKYDKAASILHIIVEGAQAVVHQLTSGDPYTAVPRAIAVGALSAAELAIAVATPIPKYKKGTNSAPGGLSIVGDAGRELAVDPYGRITIYEKPTLVDIMKGTKIYPNDITEAMINCQDAHIGHIMSLPMPESRSQPAQDDRIEEVISELKTLNKNSRITIYNDRSIESRAEYDRLFKH